MSKAAAASKRCRDKFPERMRLLNLLGNARRRAAAKGIAFSITKDDIVIPETCPILGVPLQFPDGVGPHDYSPSLDRIRPELGYVPGNVLVISYRANRIRNDATAEELARVLAYARRCNE